MRDNSLKTCNQLNALRPLINLCSMASARELDTRRLLLEKDEAGIQADLTAIKELCRNNPRLLQDLSNLKRQKLQEHVFSLREKIAILETRALEVGSCYVDVSIAIEMETALKAIKNIAEYFFKTSVEKCNDTSVVPVDRCSEGSHAHIAPDTLSLLRNLANNRCLSDMAVEPSILATSNQPENRGNFMFDPSPSPSSASQESYTNKQTNTSTSSFQNTNSDIIRLEFRCPRWIQGINFSTVLYAIIIAGFIFILLSSIHLHGGPEGFLKTIFDRKQVLSSSFGVF
ncbi:hypothetical protein CHS0354_021217 [Potamilus streckersoni]|uniref:Uncharacterized protein n=1 Tax=Potamilus streckersoni TaxID=2493646 RepID=A0AAE0W1L2_9BIVA|nr:hypothetical protein CHS0354_021217 [Potamilus streckersoni]